MTESAVTAMVQAAGLELSAAAGQTIRQAGHRDERLGPDSTGQAARRAVVAWALAVNGDNSALADLADAGVASVLLHPARKPWQLAPGPAVTRIEIVALDLAAGPPQLRITFEFSGQRHYYDHDDGSTPASRAGNRAEDETQFIGLLTMTLQGGPAHPWRLTAGSVSTLDEYLGYVFTARQETSTEYRQRTGAAVPPPPGHAAGQPREFRLVAGFAEHDVRFGSSAAIVVRQASAPTRAEAAELIWPAICAKTARALGEGDWRPSMNWLDVIELLARPDAGQ
jgi:hypothetical protein